MSHENEEPKWLDEDNDDSHKAEIAPLFGTGNVSLHGEPAAEDHHFDTEQQAEHGASKPGYGTLNNQEDEDFQTTVSNSSSKQSKQSTKSGSKQSKATKSGIGITESGKPEMPRPNCCMAAFHFIESLGVITAIAMMGSQILPLIVIPLKEIGISSICLKIYISLFSIIFILLECDVPIGFLRSATFLQAFFSRGFLYSFIGLSALEEAYSERVGDMIAHSKDQFHVSWFSLFMQVSSWMMLGLGCVYMLFGLCCMKALRDRLKREHNGKWETYREAMKLYHDKNP